jgi:hypothetical protein
MILAASSRADTSAEGIISALDLGKRTITFRKDDGFIVVLNWTAKEGTINVSIDGDQASLKELKRGERVRLAYFRETRELYGIEILRRPRRGYLPGTAERLKEIRNLVKEGEKEDALKRLDELIKALGE